MNVSEAKQTMTAAWSVQDGHLECRWQSRQDSNVTRDLLELKYRLPDAA